jgi:HAD superfamily hydrolase (TIGR01509 family)
MSVGGTAERLGWSAGIRAVVFDMDGVLVDSSGCHRDSFLEIFRDLGIRDFQYARFAGWRTTDVFRTVLAENAICLEDGAIRDLANTKSRLARERLLASLPFAPECAEILGQLAPLFKLGLATSASRTAVALFFRATGTRQLFDSVLTGEDVSLGKPSPEIYLRSATNLELPASACIVVEDAVAGVFAAKRAGAGVVGLVGTCSAQELEQAGAECTVGCLSELLNLLCHA